MKAKDYLLTTLYFLIPALILGSLGLLEFKFPEAMADFDDNYTGRGVAGLILIVLELILKVTWGHSAGILLMAIATVLLTLCLLMIGTAFVSKLKKQEVS